MRFLNSPQAAGDEASLKGMLSAITFIIEQSVKNECSANDLQIEMQHLGLPHEHCKQLAKLYLANYEKLRSVSVKDFIRDPAISIVSLTPQEDNKNVSF
ncbi:unnamed protein product [Dracunculus medinensis]|uniref:Uncharacterized protein n=1 Tax=Dracunculus medinensis TaxID=318479 RepID=A0A0N4U7H1_DRAME|nr:unnamed protein product [Dracunculus medinensis]